MCNSRAAADHSLLRRDVLSPASIIARKPVLNRDEP
jgi:hypothetical protein